MTRLCFLSLLLLSFAAPALSALADVAAILERQRQHGFESPAAAIVELEAVRADVAAPAAPLDLRMRYHSALASLYISAEDYAKVPAELAALERMAATEACAPCRQLRLVREVHQAIRRQDLAAAGKAIAALEALPAPKDRDVLQALHYIRAGYHDAMGRHAGAIEEGIAAARLAADTGNHAEQVRALNVLMLASIGRRDLPRAEAYGNDAYALAERIGFTYMMAYLRANQAWLHSLKGETAQQYRALMDALRITRDHPGLADAELVNLVNLAEYHLLQGEHRRARDAAEQAVALATRQGKDTAKGVALGTAGLARFHMGEVDLGLATMRQSVALLEAEGARSYLIDASQQLADAYEAAGRYRDAAAALRKVAELRAEAARGERDRAVAEAQEGFSAERKDREIERLSLDNARRQAEVAARTAQQRLWAAAAVALALGAILLAQLVSRTRSRNRALERSNAALSEQSVHDPLTGAFNRRHCHALMGQQEALIATRAGDRAYSPNVGLVLLDVDRFKAINDNHGHAAGDAVLVEVARRLQQLVRNQDTVVRWGGEEFVLVLPGTAAPGVAIVAQRVLAVIADAPFDIGGTRIPVTVSAGCVTYPLYPGEHWEEALHVADLALYLAKERGRNRAACLMGLVEGSEPGLAIRDLAAAERAGHVDLRMFEGPVPPAAG